MSEPVSDPAADAAPGGDDFLVGLADLAGRVVRELAGADGVAAASSFAAAVRARLSGSYPVDEFGFDPQLADQVFAAALRPIYRHWFRVEVRGIENVPSTGAGLVVANHSGTLPLDAIMTQLAILDEHPADRRLRLLGADLVFALPFIGEVARKGGSTLACAEDAARLLERGELVGVFPEGFKGTGKLYSQRYKLQRFGRGGFVSAALRTGSPLIPCSIVGAEETYPMLADLSTVARVVGLPYVPITPTFPWLGPLGLIPLPSKWILEFGEPMATSGYDPSAADDAALVFDVTDQVRETIQQTLYRLLTERTSAFF